MASSEKSLELIPYEFEGKVIYRDPTQAEDEFLAGLSTAGPLRPIPSLSVAPGPAPTRDPTPFQQGAATVRRGLQSAGVPPWIARFVPGTETEAMLTAIPGGALAGRAVGPLRAALGTVPRRVGAAAGIGALGGVMEGQSPGATATLTGVGQAAGEGLMRGGGLILRHFPFLGPWLTRTAERGARQAVQAVSGPLAQVMERTPGPLGTKVRETVREGGPGRDALSAAFEKGIQDVKGLLGGAKVTSPALSSVWREIRPKGATLPAHVALTPGAGGTFTIEQAARLLQEARGQAGKMMKGTGAETIKGEQLIQRAGGAEEQLINSMKKLNPKAAERFIEYNKDYAKGRAFVDIIDDAKALASTPVGPFVDSRRVQVYMSQNQASLERRFGKPVFDEVWKIVGRGGRLGGADDTELASGLGRVWLSIKGSVGLAPGTTIGRQYLGKPPLQPGPVTGGTAGAFMAQRLAPGPPQETSE